MFRSIWTCLRGLLWILKSYSNLQIHLKFVLNVPLHPKLYTSGMLQHTYENALLIKLPENTLIYINLVSLRIVTHHNWEKWTQECSSRCHFWQNNMLVFLNKSTCHNSYRHVTSNSKLLTCKSNFNTKQAWLNFLHQFLSFWINALNKHLWLRIQVFWDATLLQLGWSVLSFWRNTVPLASSVKRSFKHWRALKQQQSITCQKTNGAMKIQNTYITIHIFIFYPLYPPLKIFNLITYVSWCQFSMTHSPTLLSFISRFSGFI
jgi:hypothetical protein